MRRSYTNLLTVRDKKPGKKTTTRRRKTKSKGTAGTNAQPSEETIVTASAAPSNLAKAALDHDLIDPMPEPEYPIKIPKHRVVATPKAKAAKRQKKGEIKYLLCIIAILIGMICVALLKLYSDGQAHGQDEGSSSPEVDEHEVFNNND